MRIVHIVAGLPRTGGGLSEVVPALAREVARRGHEVSIATVAEDGADLSDATWEAVRCGVKLVRFAPAPPSRLYFSVEMLRHLRGTVAAADVVHVHSNWTFPVWWGCRLALAQKKALVMSPHGCVEPARLARSKWKKRFAGLLFDRRYLRRATWVHALSEQEAAGIRKYMGASDCSLQGANPLPNVSVIPCGVDADALSGCRDEQALGRKWAACSGKKTILFLSRLHPMKGVDLLLDVWAQIAGAHAGWHLMIAGPDENGFGAALGQKARAAGLQDRVTFCGPLFGEEKVLALRNAELFVLPSQNENFGLVVAESLACGVPVIATNRTPWPELCGAPGRHAESGEAGGRAGWWIDFGEEPLKRALEEAMGLPDEARRRMGENGRKIVAKSYLWGSVASKLEDAYRESLRLQADREP